MAPLGIIGCGVLINELAYLIKRDPDVNRVTAIDNEMGRLAADRLERSKACHVVELADPERLRPTSHRNDEVLVWLNPSDLHDSQEKMRSVLTAEMELLTKHVDGVFMMYGQCRCQTLDVRALQAQLGIPITFLTDRSNEVVDDCFAATLGGCREYQETMREQKGTLFVTPGYVERHTRQQQGMGILMILDQVDQLKEVLDYIGYTSVLKLDNQLDGFDDYDEMVRIFCRTFDLDLRVMLCNLAVFEDSYDLAKSSIRPRAEGRRPMESYSVVWD